MSTPDTPQMIDWLVWPVAEKPHISFDPKNSDPGKKSFKLSGEFGDATEAIRALIEPIQALLDEHGGEILNDGLGTPSLGALLVRTDEATARLIKDLDGVSKIGANGRKHM